MGKVLVFFLLQVSLAHMARAQYSDAASALGTYASVDARGRIQLAVRVVQRNEEFDADVWRYGKVRHFGALAEPNGLVYVHEGATRPSSLRITSRVGRVLDLKDWVRLSESALWRSIQYDAAATARISAGGLSFETFLDGHYADAPPLGACELFFEIPWAI